MYVDGGCFFDRPSFTHTKKVGGETRDPFFFDIGSPPCVSSVWGNHSQTKEKTHFHTYSTMPDGEETNELKLALWATGRRHVRGDPFSFNCTMTDIVLPQTQNISLLGKTPPPPPAR